MGRSKACYCLLSVLLVVLLEASVVAQSGTSIIRGTVTDPQGSVVTGASVKITNMGTNQTRTQNTNDSGYYAFELVPTGDYRIEVEAKGFKKKAVNEVHALVGKPTEVGVRLEVGGIGEVVEVTVAADQVLLNTQDATLGNNFISQQITQLPLEARNVVDLLTLQPGVTREGYVAGARADQSNVTLDGVDVNNQQSANVDAPTADNTLTFGQLSSGVNGPVLRLNADAIEEFRVTTLNANANQGRSSGAQVNLVTKGGTNALHGSLFEVHRNTIFTANDWFLNHTGQEREKLIRNTFGGSLGGPIWKDRAFFFYSYEGRRDATEDSDVRVVPLPHLGQGEMRYEAGPGNIQTLNLSQLNAAFPGVGMNPAAISVLAAAAAQYPANDTSSGDGLNTGGFRFKASTPVKLNSHVAKLDLNLTNKQTAFARANVIHDVTNFLPRFPDTPSPALWSHPWGMVAGHTWSLTNRLVNNFRYGYTRQAFSQTGDSTDDFVSFRFVFQPRLFQRDLGRTTPVHNFTDDMAYVSGNHTWQFGTNVRVVRNSRNSFSNAFDTALANPSFYDASGAVLSTTLNDYLAMNGLPLATSISASQNALSALIGRFSQYEANFTFARDGSLLPAGSPSERTFATEEYDFYVQDTWKAFPSLTFTLGLRYGLARPVYETNGFEVQPNIPLGEYLARRSEAAAAGQSFVDPLTIDLSGPKNNGDPMYRWDKNNFQPRVAFAWSPNPEGGFLRALFGGQGKSVLRGGGAITNDYYGQALAVDFDLNNTLGFTSNFTTPANTFDVSSNPAPVFTGFNQDARSLPLVVIPGTLTFPQLQPSDFARRIETSVDEDLKAPTQYSWNLTYERELPFGMVAQASYIGRIGRNLLARRDAMAPTNLVDPQTGVDWYNAAGQLEILRAQGASAASVATIPYFENLFPTGAGGLGDQFWGDPAMTNTQAVYLLASNEGAGFGNDWTFVQDTIEFFTGTSYFFQPQYGTLSAWSTVANSNYHGLALSLRQRLSSFTMDFNYTFSHSLDDASGVQNALGFDTSSFILNPFRQRDFYASSDFDVRHQINANTIWELPFGRGKMVGDAMHPAVDAIVGGWQISSIFRWNTGLPIIAPYDDARWATNWNVQSFGTAVQPVKACPGIAPSGDPKLFACNTLQAYASYRNARPGETGQRNSLRLPGYVDLDLGLAKSWGLPWEGHKLQLRWDVFNVTNTQRFGAVDTSRTGFGLQLDPATTTPTPDWSNFIGIQGSQRVMQVGLRYQF